MKPQDPPARAYQEVIAELTAAADGLRDRDRDRAAELGRELAALDEVMARAADRAALTRFGVAMQWEDVLDALWSESWLTLRLLPDPSPAPGPPDLDRLAALDAAVELRAAALQAAARRRFGFPGR